MASSTRNQGSVRAPFVNINQLTRSGASNGDVLVFNSPRWGVGEGGGGGGARYIEPFLAFEFGPITDALWAMAPPGVLFWCQDGQVGEGRMTRGFYRTDGTSTVVRDESYDVDAPFTVIHVLVGLYEDVSDFVDQQAHPAGMSLLWVFSDWNATKEMPANYVGTTAKLVTVDYEPENYTPSLRYEGAGVFRPGRLLGDHLAGIDNAIGGHWESSTYGGSGGAMSPIPERPKWVMFDATDDDVDYTILDPDFFGAYDSVDYSFSRIDDNAANTVTLIGEISGVTDMTLEPRQSITIRKFSGQWHLISSAIAT